MPHLSPVTHKQLLTSLNQCPTHAEATGAGAAMDGDELLEEQERQLDEQRCNQGMPDLGAGEHVAAENCVLHTICSWLSMAGLLQYPSLPFMLLLALS